MESTHKVSYHAHPDALDMQEHFENTNPFANRTDVTRSAKPGKRPRILKPLYSARLS